MMARHCESVASSARGWARWIAVFCLVAPGLVSADPSADLKPAYRLGVFPYLPALTIDRLYGPLAEELSFEIDRLIKVRTKSTFENFERAIEEQSYDILFVHPFFYVDAVDNHHYLPLARLDQPLRAVLVAPDDATTRALADLEGQTIGLPPKLAAVSTLIKSAMIDEGYRPGLDIGVRHFRNKASCLQATATGAVAACGLPAFVLDEVDTFDAHALRIIFEAPPVSHFAFAVHSRIPEADRERLRDFLLSLDGGAIEGFGADKQFVRIEDGDYAGIPAKTTRLDTLAQR